MKKLIFIILCLLLGATTVRATEYRLLDLEKFGMEYWKTDQERDPYLPYQQPGSTTPGERWKDGAAVTFNLTLAAIGPASLYWDNRVHEDSTNKQVRFIGWEWEAGASWDRQVDIFWHHHSQHLLDQSSDMRYPLENHYGVRFTFYERAKSHD
jgi:hypothetical protein